MNQGTAPKLGCEFKVSGIKTWFPHPQDGSSRIHVRFDACQMLKLMRILLGDHKVICHKENMKLHKIKLGYNEALNNVQEDLGFTFANTLKRKHIIRIKNKMNVSLAAQTLRSSVAKAIDFLQDEIAMPIFEESE